MKRRAQEYDPSSRRGEKKDRGSERNRVIATYALATLISGAAGAAFGMHIAHKDANYKYERAVVATQKAEDCQTATEEIGYGKTVRLSQLSPEMQEACDYDEYPGGVNKSADYPEAVADSLVELDAEQEALAGVAEARSQRDENRDTGTQEAILWALGSGATFAAVTNFVTYRIRDLNNPNPRMPQRLILP